MPGLLVLVAMLMTCTASADHAAMVVEVKALVEHGYDQARHDGEGGPPPLPSLRAAVGSETVDRLVAAIARPEAAGATAWEAFGERFAGWLVRAGPIGHGDRRALLSVVIIGSPATETVATMRFGEVAMPVRIAEIVSRPFHERPRDRGIVIDPRGEDEKSGHAPHAVHVLSSRRRNRPMDSVVDTSRRLQPGYGAPSGLAFTATSSAWSSPCTVFSQ